MSLLVLDSYDDYLTADLLETYTQIYTAGGEVDPVVHTSAGRRSSSGLRFSTGSGAGSSTAARGIAIVPGATGATAIIGAAFNFSAGTWAGLNDVGTSMAPNALGSQPAIFQVRQGGTTQVALRPNTNGTLSVCRGDASTVVLGTSGTALAAGTSYYIELAVTIHGSTGTVTVRVNATNVLSLTSQNTQATGSATWDEVVLGHLVKLPAGVNTWDFDDLYIADGSGTSWNSLKGDLKVTVLRPTGAGGLTAWTPSTGSNYQNVDDITPDDDTTYNAATTVGSTDLFVCDDLGASDTPLGLQVRISAKRATAGAASIAPVIRMSSTDYAGTTVGLNASYAYVRQPYGVRPSDSAAWTAADINAAQFGYYKAT